MSQRSDTHIGDLSRRFPTTQWTQLEDPSFRESVLQELAVKYWRPLYAYIQSKGYVPDQAKDIVQDFFSEKVLGQQLVDRADRSKGRFRDFLLTSIRNHAANILRKNRYNQSISEDFEAVSSEKEPQEVFQRAWAQNLLEQVLLELKQECYCKEKQVHWQIFQQWFLEDPSDNRKSMSVICARNGISDPATAYNMIANMKIRFRAILKDSLTGEVGPRGDIQAEISHFLQLFSSSSTK